MTDKIYNLDQAATTRVLPEAIEEAVKYMDEYYYNPSAIYRGANEVHSAVCNARSRFAEMLGVKSDEIIFTSGGSEGNCLAIDGSNCDVLVTTNVEHKSIENNLLHDVRELPVNENGIVTYHVARENAKHLFIDERHLVSVQHVNNETGVIQPVSHLFDIIKEEANTDNILFHSDGTQAVGHIPMEEIRRTIRSCDMYSFSGHKFGAPKGIGILVKKQNVRLSSIIHGTQNFKVRGGTENVPGIMAMLVAMKQAEKNSTDENLWKNYGVREKLFRGLNAITPVEKTVDDTKVMVIPNILSVRFKDPNISGEALIGFLSAFNVYCSLGSACNAGQSGMSHVLHALHVKEEDAMRTIRISFPDGLTDDDVKEILGRFKVTIEKLKKIKAN